MALPEEGEHAAGAAPKSTHVSDPALLPFLQPTFDPARYLNATLPSLSLSLSLPLAPAAPPAPTQRPAVPLADLATRTQVLLSQLTAQTSRLSATLTQLTDDILRAGGRLAYEVELLRGETAALSDALAERLSADVRRFVPGGLAAAAPDGPATPAAVAAAAPTTTQPPEPDHMTRLRTLAHVRARLDAVVQTFNDAMQWPLPPPPESGSIASALLSVSGPSPSSSSSSSSSSSPPSTFSSGPPTSQAREEAARAFADGLRAEIAGLAAAGAGAEGGGEAAARARVRRLRELAAVWRGTAEERARVRFVEGLERMVEERAGAGRDARAAGGEGQGQAGAEGKGRGFLENLQRIRGNIYLE